MRRVWTFALLCLLTTVGMQSLATDNRKLSGYVRQLASRSERAASRDGVKLQKRSQTVTAFLQVENGKADEVVHTFGLQCHATMDDICIVSIPLDCLAALSDNPCVRRIEASPSACLTMDTTAVIVNALSAYQPSPALHLPAFTGEGVVVGIMDVGFDLGHPTFFDETGTRYRVGAFWDQISKDTVGSQFPVGRDYVGYEEVLAQSFSADSNILTHGTHTAGIAAGSGYGSRYRGMAYGSDICLVNNAVSNHRDMIDSLDLPKYTTATDALGFKYLFDYADQQGKPCVASFSEGYSPILDEEDSLYAEALSKLCGPGHIIVSSAGNNGYSNTYMEKPKGVNEAGCFLYTGEKKLLYRLRTDGPLNINFCIYDNAGDVPYRTHSISSADERLDSVLVDSLFIGNDTCIIYVERHADSMGARTDTVYVLNFEVSTWFSQLPPVAIVLEGSESYAELFGSNECALAGNPIDSRWNADQPGHNIFAPSCFASVVCVGSTSHRGSVVNSEGEVRSIGSTDTHGLRSAFSSTGPSMNHLQKPDVMAPGTNIVSAYNRKFLLQHPGDVRNVMTFTDFQGELFPWGLESGTSMSGPVVAGIIALWLQAKPDLTQQEVYDIFSRTCRLPDANLHYPNNEYGYGEIDAYRGLLYVLGVDKIEGVSNAQPYQASVTFSDGRLKFCFSNPPTRPFRVSIYRLNGTVVDDVTLQPTVSSYPLSELSSGIYVVQITTQDDRSTGSTIIRI